MNNTDTNSNKPLTNNAANQVRNAANQTSGTSSPLDALKNYFPIEQNGCRIIVQISINLPCDSQREDSSSHPATKADVKQIVDADGDKTRKSTTCAKNEIKRTIVKATSEPSIECHHPNKQKDLLVQKVINFIAEHKGCTVNNACVKVAGLAKNRQCKETWLYDWCNSHKSKLLSNVELLRSLNR